MSAAALINVLNVLMSFDSVEGFSSKYQPLKLIFAVFKVALKAELIFFFEIDPQSRYSKK